MGGVALPTFLAHAAIWDAEGFDTLQDVEPQKFLKHDSMDKTNLEVGNLLKAIASAFVCWQFRVKIFIVLLLDQSHQVLPWTLAFSKLFIIEDCYRRW